MTKLFDIQNRFPYMFSKNIGIEISRGWISVFEQVCVDIDTLLGTDRRSFQWTQCKEKFGSARWYWSMSPNPNETNSRPRIKIHGFNSEDGSVHDLNPVDPTTVPTSMADKIGAIVAAGQKKTQNSCLICGAQAKQNLHKGYAMVLCVEPTRECRAGGLDHYWAEE